MRLKGVNIIIGVEVPKLRWSCNRTVFSSRNAGTPRGGGWTKGLPRH